MNNCQQSLKPILFVVLSCLLFCSCGEGTTKSDLEENPEEEEAFFVNPVIDRNFPDPTVIAAPDGFFYVYATNSKVGEKTHNLQVQRSKDLVNWEVLEDAMPEKPTWGSYDFWAPHITYDQVLEKYILYYSAESNDASVGKCLGIALSDSPSGPFSDIGEPFLCGESFVNIDPMVYVDPASEKKYFYWGSGHESIKVRELAPDGIRFEPDSEVIELIQPVRNDHPDNYENLVEGAWVIKRNKYYYLFYSGDNCCGDQAHYAVMVARSTSPTGPFAKFRNDEGNSTILVADEEWRAPGHNSVIQDEAGDYWMAYHAIDLDDPGAGRKMLLDKITWKDDWPVVNDGTPSNEKTASPKFN